MGKSNLTVVAEVSQVFALPLIIVIGYFSLDGAPAAQASTHWWSSVFLIPWPLIIVVLVAAGLNVWAAIINRGHHIEIEARRASDIELEKLKQENARLTAGIAKLEQGVSEEVTRRVTAENELSDLKKEDLGLNAQLAVANDDVRRLEAETKFQEQELAATKGQLETQTGLNAQLESSYKALKNRHDAVIRQFGKMLIEYSGMESKPAGLTVAVQFIDHRDADLAKQIRASFYSDIGMSPYRANEGVKHVQWSENPSIKARVVLFSDYKFADGITGAFNDCDILLEKIDLREKRADMQADITFVIFDKVARDNR